MRDSIPARRRGTLVLFTGAALGSIAHIASVTIAALAVVELTGNATFAGVPGAAGILGTAAGSLVLPRLFRRWNLRVGLVVGYLAAVIGNLISVGSLATASLPLLLAGMALAGTGAASNHLTRYAAAELYPTERKAGVVGIIVWAGTLGSVIGPLLLQPSAGIATGLRRSPLTGGFLVGAVFMATVVVLYLAALRISPASAPLSRLSEREAVRPVTARRSVRLALTALTGSQVVMVIVMTATPLHVGHHGRSLDEVGLVMMAHTLGMFGLAPLIGRWTDRRGPTPALIAGIAVLAGSAFFGAILTSTPTVLLAAVLFFLGVGWSLAFVAGSSILATATRAGRIGIQGRADALVWLAGGAASISSGAIYAATDFRTVALIGLLVVTGLTLMIAWRWRPSAQVLAEAH